MLFQFKNTLIFLSLFFGTLSFAEVESLSTSMKEGHQIVISSIPHEEQEAFLKELHQRLDQNPEAAVLFATTGAQDPINELRAANDLKGHPQVVLTEAQSIDDLAVTQKSKGIKAKLKSFWKANGSLNSEKKVALAVSIIPAGNYATMVYFMSSDYLLATASFGTVLAVNAFQALFTKQWLYFASLGDKAAVSTLKALGQLVGHEPKEKSRRLAGAFGRIGLTVGMNTALASIQMTLSGTLDSAWALLYFGYTSSYDLWDQVLEDKINQSKWFKKYFINTRLSVGSLVECLALAGNGVAEIILAGASVSSTLGILFKATQPNTKVHWRQRVKVKWETLKSKFAVPSPCENLLVFKETPGLAHVS